MGDRRKALKNGACLDFGDSKKIIIDSEVGRGGSCIVYNAAYVDQVMATHRVRIKECYPCQLLLERACDGTIAAGESEITGFQAEKERFKEAYRRNVNLRNTIGLVNSTISASELLEQNGTYYSLMAFDEGEDYCKAADESLKKLFEHIYTLAEVIKRYHDCGYLHLDIKPENVFIIPETEGHILLFDFDSVTAFDELEKNSKIRLVVSDGFSAPEQLQGKVDRIGRHTDIYAIGALVFYKIFGRTPEVGDCKISAVYDFSHMNYQDKRFQPGLYRKIEEF